MPPSTRGQLDADPVSTLRAEGGLLIVLSDGADGDANEVALEVEADGSALVLHGVDAFLVQHNYSQNDTATNAGVRRSPS